jgi:predicted Abi (CAAX) family protease
MQVDITKEAVKAVEAFFQTFNAHDSNGNLKTMHFPHIRINGSGQVNIVQSAADVRPLDAVLSYLTETEGWHHSTLDSVEMIHASDIKVHFDIQFSRYKADGSKYAVHKSLWIVTKKNGQWGIQTRSSFAP